MNRLRRAFSVNHKDGGPTPSTSKSTPSRHSQPPPYNVASSNNSSDSPRRSIFGKKLSTLGAPGVPSQRKHNIFGRRSREQERPLSAIDTPPSQEPSDVLLEKPTSPTSKSTIIKRKSSRHLRGHNEKADSLTDLRPAIESLPVEQQAEEYLQRGLEYHEKGELEKATVYWKMSADRENPLGLFFYGIALRHGWGCKANPPLAVTYLQKAADHAVTDLYDSIARHAPATVARGELTIAIYELGVSFRHGWGVPKNKQTAAYYFRIAADLGDADAQNDLAFCYMEGEGVKKDLMEAAKWFRRADKQGHGMVGNSWIWKEKYNEVDNPSSEKDQIRRRTSGKESRKTSASKKEASVEKSKT